MRVMILNQEIFALDLSFVTGKSERNRTGIT